MVRRALRHSSILLAVAAAIVAAASLGPTSAEERPTLEYQVKAAYLHNFAQFTDWPESAFRDTGGEFVITVIGEDPFGPALDALRDRKVGERLVRVRRIRAPSELTPTHLLFVPASQEDRLARIFAATRDRPILTVGESQGFAREGGIIEFVHRDQKIRFEANVDVAAGAGLRISSKLLRLAVEVRGTE